MPEPSRTNCPNASFFLSKTLRKDQIAWHHQGAAKQGGPAAPKGRRTRRCLPRFHRENPSCLSKETTVPRVPEAQGSVPETQELLVAIPGRFYLFPFRTEPSSSPGPMVLPPCGRESRSPPTQSTKPPRAIGGAFFLLEKIAAWIKICIFER